MRISYRELDGGKRAPRWYGFSHSDFKRGIEIFYPMPINWIVRYCLKAYWRFLMTIYWVGLIDVGMAMAFYWGAFYRIKSQH